MTAQTRLWLVRHGPTHADYFVGWSDVPADLSDTAQIARLEAWLPPDALLVSSDLDRCVKTADAVQGQRTRLPHDPDLREFNFGDWERKQFRELSKEYPDLTRKYWEDPGDHAPPGGESWNEGAARVTRGMDRLIARHSGSDIVVVGHFGMILTQIQRAAGLTPKQALAFTIDNLSVTELWLEAGFWRVAGINHTP